MKDEKKFVQEVKTNLYNKVAGEIEGYIDLAKGTVESLKSQKKEIDEKLEKLEIKLNILRAARANVGKL